MITKIRLLTEKEFEQYHKLIPSHYAWWWLDAKGHGSPETRWVNTAKAVSPAKGIDHAGTPVTYDVNVARPVIEFTQPNVVAGTSFSFGGKTWTALNKNIAICNTDIGYCVFNLDDAAGTDYKHSEIKRYIESWFSQAQGLDVYKQNQARARQVIDDAIKMYGDKQEQTEQCFSYEAALEVIEGIENSAEDSLRSIEGFEETIKLGKELLIETISGAYVDADTDTYEDALDVLDTISDSAEDTLLKNKGLHAALDTIYELILIKLNRK